MNPNESFRILTVMTCHHLASYNYEIIYTGNQQPSTETDSLVDEWCIASATSLILDVFNILR